MVFPLFKIIFILFSLFSHSIAKLDPSGSNGYSVREMIALFALKATFNDLFLNQNWTGIHCLEGIPPQWYGIQCDIDSAHVTGIVLEDMHLTGKIDSDAFVDITELQVVSFRNNLISGNVTSFSSNPKLKDVDLSGNRLYGQISSSLLSLEFLESLQLQNNNLTGPIPEFNQSSLKVFNVSNNHLIGTIPKTKTLQSFSRDSYSNNPDLCGPPSSNSCSLGGDDKAGSDDFRTFYLLFAAAGIITVVLLLIFYLKKARKPNTVIKKEEHRDQEKVSGDEEERIEKNIETGKGQLVVAGEDSRQLIFVEDEEQEGFQLNDLLKAPAEGLGKGIFGNSYKAMLEGRAPVVVKRVRDLKPLSNEEFTKQLRVIADQKHPNLLPLLAYCYSKDEKLLVYKYAGNGNLFKRIHGGKTSKNRIPFRWRSRLLVARGVARALEYLHHNNSIHGNLKSTNILLDENEMVLVSDHGFSSIVALPIAAQRMISYKSPEYQSSKKISRKSDVWSYGCLVLELLTGRISAHSAPPGINGMDLFSWVLRTVREEWTAEIFDPEISIQRSAANGMLKLLQVAIQCCNKSPEKRPEITEVMRELENIKVIGSSEEEEDISVDPSLTDESLSASVSASLSASASERR